jgi:hypothetical protein
VPLAALAMSACSGSGNSSASENQTAGASVPGNDEAGMRLYAACAQRAENVSQAAMMQGMGAGSGGGGADVTRGRSESDWSLTATALDRRANQIAGTIGKATSDVSAIRLAESQRLRDEQQRQGDAAFGNWMGQQLNECAPLMAAVGAPT